MAAESSKRTGSGFISRNNDDATAEATFRFMEQSGIPRKLTVILERSSLVEWDTEGELPRTLSRLNMR